MDCGVVTYCGDDCGLLIDVGESCDVVTEVVGRTHNCGKVTFDGDDCGEVIACVGGDYDKVKDGGNGLWCSDRSCWSYS